MDVTANIVDDCIDSGTTNQNNDEYFGLFWIVQCTLYVYSRILNRTVYGF